MNKDRNLDRFDFALDLVFGIDYALNADPDHKFPHQLVRTDTKDTIARVRDPELAIALAAIWTERQKLKGADAGTPLLTPDEFMGWLMKIYQASMKVGPEGGKLEQSETLAEFYIKYIASPARSAA